MINLRIVTLLQIRYKFLTFNWSLPTRCYRAKYEFELSNFISFTLQQPLTSLGQKRGFTDMTYFGKPLRPIEFNNHLNTLRVPLACSVLVYFVSRQ